jgi:hypothetical protein
MSGIWTIFLVSGLVFGLLSSVIWSNKGGNAVSAFLLGALLGLIGLLIVLVANPSKAAVSSPQGGVGQGVVRQCPWCKEAMKRDASVCPHCQRESSPWTFHEGRWWSTDTQGEWVFLNERTREWMKLPPPPAAGQ